MQRFDLYLLKEAIHGLLYFEIFFEEHAELIGVYKLVVGSGNFLEASTCLAK